MIKAGIDAFKGKHVLLLQGPVGPFFHRLARDLTNSGAQVHKVNFIGGDAIFYPTNATYFRGEAADWPDFFNGLLARYNIDVIMLFGDCRPHHRVAHAIAQLRGIAVGVFEEGYVRPNFITLETSGVNGNSLLPKDMAHYQAHESNEQAETLEVGKTFAYAALWAAIYYLASSILWPVFWRYNHHRPLNLLEGLYWARSIWRKKYYAQTERNVLKKLTAECNGNYFLVPLQVHNDAQIHFHSKFSSVSDFIRAVMLSFATHAPNGTWLVIKHHPLDRGYNDYTKYIATLAKLYGITARVRYIHDQHLPTLFDHARGVVVVNSTVGLSALHHALPVKTCGEALYDILGLTFQGSLDQFWQQASFHTVDSMLYHNFRHYLVSTTQLNGNFYKRLDIADSLTGIVWKL